MPDCLIALGGNLGCVGETFDRACELLAKSPGIQLGRVSQYHRTKPVGQHAGGEYVNAAAHLITDRSAIDLLDLLQAIEKELGRVTKGDQGPRTLDLDVLFHGDAIIDVPRLRVPHPACWYRRFVLDPLVEIAPDFVHPELRRTVKHLRDVLMHRPFHVRFIGADLPSLERSRDGLMTRLRRIAPEIVVSTDADFNNVPCVPTMGIQFTRSPTAANRTVMVTESSDGSENERHVAYPVLNVVCPASHLPTDDVLNILTAALGE